MLVKGVICRQCACFVYARAPLDLRQCPGKHIAVGTIVRAPRSPFSTAESLAGGVPSEFRRESMAGALQADGFYRLPGCDLPMSTFLAASAEVRTTAEALFYDWNNCHNKFGMIPAPAYPDFHVRTL